ncbi:MAG TPA: hypothetical protein VGX48_16895 [Pyrinomonadaceae bacterium]|nr:hypothetical protein [Pyrinomonadaceae bacterium]
MSDITKREELIEDPIIRIALPEKYWVIILALLEKTIKYNLKPEWEKLKKKGIDVEALDEVQVTTLIGPVIARGIIIKELVAMGVMKQEADDRLGVDKLVEMAQKYRDKHGL